jgi:hypothetical protein
LGLLEEGDEVIAENGKATPVPILRSSAWFSFSKLYLLRRKMPISY